MFLSYPAAHGHMWRNAILHDTWVIESARLFSENRLPPNLAVVFLIKK